VALRLAVPLRLAAIDAGSNALRLLIARVFSSDEWEVLEVLRAPVRLGHSAFSRRKFDRKILNEAAAAFRQFRRAMDRHGVTAYRAVATSAAREARNRHLLVERIQRQAGIDLEVISGNEEARLVRAAALRAHRGHEEPRYILDLGGGSLEINELRNGALRRSIGLPLGTVRLMEAFRVQGAIHENTAAELQRHALNVLQTAFPDRPRSAGALAVVSGGNAETLAPISPGPRFAGLSTLNLRLLRERLWQILGRDVSARMQMFGVRRDRAEVMGIAAIVLLSAGSWLRLRSMVVPRVGVREGILAELAAAQFNVPEANEEQRKHALFLMTGVQTFGVRLRADSKHSEQVRRLSLQLFDQLWPYHRMNRELRNVLEAAAVLHDAGHFVHRKGHHRHGEYLIRNARIAGLRGWEKNVAACLVRFHNGKTDPGPAHKLFSALPRTRRRDTRILAGILRLAERLESDHKQVIAGLSLDGGPRDVRVLVEARAPVRLNLPGLERKASLLERELQLRFSFHRNVYAAKERVA